MAAFVNVLRNGHACRRMKSREAGKGCGFHKHRDLRRFFVTLAPLVR
jgi:hypothetical protein